VTPEDKLTTPPAFARDTLGDKVARFGCGATLGLLVVMGLLLTGVFELFGSVTGVSVGAATLIILAGVACVTHGEPAIQVLWKLIKWLA
jgi:Na+/proline symporter